MADLIVIIVYFLVILAVGLFARRMIRTEQDFVVAGRRLGPLLYGGTLCAVVRGGASTIGGVGLGYVYGLSGMWLVFAIGCGVMVLSICFAGTIRRLRVYTVGEMLELRYGAGARTLSGVIMALYTLLICVVSTIACGALLSASFGIGTVPAMILGGAVVSIVVGSLTTLGTMAYLEDIYASLPILLGLGSSTAAFVCASLLFPACHPSIGARWHARLKGAEPNAGILQSSSGAQND